MGKSRRHGSDFRGAGLLAIAGERLRPCATSPRFTRPLARDAYSARKQQTHTHHCPNTPGSPHTLTRTTAHTARARTPSSSNNMVSKILFWSGFGTRKHPVQEGEKVTKTY